ncbi:hypothetical protein PtA15_5A889 [Puccinia triticina]|nr:uncharacterized protein PtA15_5A889 [Puccinia triticina]WAQ85314.1 hypothetical protein PtA15_5A889 [Puccinia triticina]WAR58607.1 hypothetical protein PtB15_5B841 [Puccinia triticina]
MWVVNHSDEDHYILNAGSLHNPHLHHSLSNLPLDPPTPADWVEAMAKGLDICNDGGDGVQSDQQDPSESSCSEDDDAKGETDFEDTGSQAETGSTYNANDVEWNEDSEGFDTDISWGSADAEGETDTKDDWAS